MVDPCITVVGLPPPPQLSQVQSVCEMEAVAVSSTMEASALASDCARHDDKDDDDKDHERKGWAKNVTEKEVMLNQEQKGTITMEVRQVNVNTDVMSGDDNGMVFWLLNAI